MNYSQNTELTKELIGLEKKYWHAMENHDLDAALELTDFPCLVAGPQGSQLVNREQFTKMFESHQDGEMKVEFKNEPQVRILSEDFAVIGYQVKSQMKIKGQPTSLEAVDTSTWIRRNGKWVCAHHTETPLTQH